MEIPNNGQLVQSNKGETDGNLFASFNVDLYRNQGKITSGGGMKKAINQADDADFDSYCSNIVYFDSKYWAYGDVFFTATSINGSWTQDTTSGTPTTGNTVSDCIVWDSKLLAVDGDDIDAYTAGGSFSTWWTTLAGTSALTTGNKILLNVGSIGRLQVVDGGNKVHTVQVDDTVSLAGSNGALDYSATDLIFTCIESTSSRTWIGTKSTSEGEAVILEWDEAVNSKTVNRQHKVGAEEVKCIAIWNDTPIALLSNGKIKYFDGNNFVDWPNAQLGSIRADIFLDDDFIHPNGWAIIDGLPHFFISGTKETGGGSYTEANAAPYDIPSGIWCLDPERGLYHRFAVGAGLSTEIDYGMPAIGKPGCLVSFEDTNTKFLASFDYYTDATTLSYTLVYHDKADTNPHRSFFVTQPMRLNEVPQSVELYHKILNSGDKIRLYYRQFDRDSVVMEGGWEEQDKFNSTTNFGDTKVGNVALVKSGSGAGQLLKISAVENTGSTYSLRFSDTNTFVTVADTGTVEVLPFNYMGEIDNTVLDWKSITIPSNVKGRKLQLLVEIQAAAGDKVVVDSVII